MRKTKVYNLPFEQTLPYFIDHIQCGKHLSQSVCREIDFTRGHFFTILPRDINEKRLCQFEYGGMISPIDDEENGKIIITMDNNLSEYIYEYLQKDSSNVVVVENYMLDISSPFAQLKNVSMSYFDNELYYVINQLNSKMEIYDAIRKSSLVWHFLTVLSELDVSVLERLTETDFKNICANAKIVIAGAYDGEGYIFWEKT